MRVPRVPIAPTRQMERFRQVGAVSSGWRVGSVSSGWSGFVRLERFGQVSASRSNSTSLSVARSREIELLAEFTALLGCLVRRVHERAPQLISKLYIGVVRRGATVRACDDRRLRRRLRAPPRPGAGVRRGAGRARARRAGASPARFAVRLPGPLVVPGYSRFRAVTIVSRRVTS